MRLSIHCKAVRVTVVVLAVYGWIQWAHGQTEASSIHDSKQLIRINDVALPELTSATSVSGAITRSFYYRVFFSGNPTSVKVDGLPPGLSFNASEGYIFGTPSVMGTFYLTATATNSAGTTVAVVTITVGLQGRLTNLSARSYVGTGERIAIVGMAIGGRNTGGSIPLLVRGVGPTMADYGVAGVLPDPRIVLRQQDTNTLLAENDDWAGDATVSAVGLKTGAFPFASTASHDAALTTNLPSGAYTAGVSSADSTAGIALTEIYDAFGDGFTPSSARLVNLSARAWVGSGANVLILGFVIEGSTPVDLLIRGVGPELARYGVVGYLADPQLVISQNLNGNLVTVATNDDWHGSKEVLLAGAAAGAFPLTHIETKDAALTILLKPGVYSVMLTGVGGTTGVALLEIYQDARFD